MKFNKTWNEAKCEVCWRGSTEFGFLMVLLLTLQSKDACSLSVARNLNFVIRCYKILKLFFCWRTGLKNAYVVADSAILFFVKIATTLREGSGCTKGIRRQICRAGHYSVLKLTRTLWILDHFICRSFFFCKGSWVHTTLPCLLYMPQCQSGTSFSPDVPLIVDGCEWPLQFNAFIIVSSIFNGFELAHLNRCLMKSCVETFPILHNDRASTIHNSLLSDTYKIK